MEGREGERREGRREGGSEGGREAEEEGRKGARGGREERMKGSTVGRLGMFTVTISPVYHCVHSHLPHQLIIALSLAEGGTVVLVSPS